MDEQHYQKITKSGFSWLKAGLISEQQLDLFERTCTFVLDPKEDPAQIRASAGWEEGERKEHTTALVARPDYFFRNAPVFIELVRFLRDNP